MSVVLTILSGFFALVVAGTGILLLAWWLWRLWSREHEEGAAQVEIELDTAVPLPDVALKAGLGEELLPEPEQQEELLPEPEEEEALLPEPEDEPEVDDLRKVEGIGPKIASVLQAGGIRTFAQLADATPDEINTILDAENPRLARLATPDSWPEQAALAADGNWDALAALQGKLKGGRRS
ncbi:MAG: helix-hairpin-helix domain-containing protein [Anaerolineae bacterium]